MSGNLNIRAAKALGWVERDNGSWGTVGAPCGITICDPEKMKFTTSYDWAMLGVEKILDDYKCCSYQSPAYRALDAFFDNFQSVVDFAESSPEQITQKWVAVLEAQDEIS